MFVSSPPHVQLCIHLLVVTATRGGGGCSQIFPYGGNTRSTRNFEVDRTISHIKEAPGTIRKLTIAVLVDYPEPASEPAPEEAAAAEGEAAPVAPAVDIEAEIAELETLIKEAVGFDEARGDRLTLMNTDFAVPPPMEQLEAPPIWQEPWVWTAAKQAAAALVVIFLIFGVLRPTMRSVSKTVAENLPAPSAAGLPAAAGGAAAAAFPGGLPEDQVTLAGTPHAQLPPAAQPSTYQMNLDQAKTIVRNEPAKAAHMIKEWIASEDR